MPILAELETLFDSKRNTNPPTEGCGGNYFINQLFHITYGCIWASEDEGNRTASFPFIMKEKFWYH